VLQGVERPARPEQRPDPAAAATRLVARQPPRQLPPVYLTVGQQVEVGQIVGQAVPDRSFGCGDLLKRGGRMDQFADGVPGSTGGGQQVVPGRPQLRARRIVAPMRCSSIPSVWRYSPAASPDAPVWIVLHVRPLSPGELARRAHTSFFIDNKLRALEAIRWPNTGRQKNEPPGLSLPPNSLPL